LPPDLGVELQVEIDRQRECCDNRQCHAPLETRPAEVD
jgi:hypothetical protein